MILQGSIKLIHMLGSLTFWKKKKPRKSRVKGNPDMTSSIWLALVWDKKGDFLSIT